MAKLFRIFLSLYLFYMHITGFLPFGINFKTLAHYPSWPWRIYSAIYAIGFIFTQFKLYYTMSLDSWDQVSFRDLRVLTVAVSYVSVLIMTTAIIVHHFVHYRRIYRIVSRLFEIIHHVKKFNLCQGRQAQQFRNRLAWALVTKAAYFEVMAALLFLDHDYSLTAAWMVDLGVKSNLWLINITTSVYVGAFLVIIYHFEMLSLRVTAICDELRRTQSLKQHRKTSSKSSSTLLPVDLSFRYCDDIDEISSLHTELRRLARQVQRLYQPLLLLTFIYHWCDFIIQAYLWYITYMGQGVFRLLTVLHYLTALVMDLVDVIFLCGVVHHTANVAAETGLMLQKFNKFDVDQRLDRTVSAGRRSRRGRQSDDNARNGGKLFMFQFISACTHKVGNILAGHIAGPIGSAHLRLVRHGQHHHSLGSYIKYRAWMRCCLRVVH